MAKQQSHTEDNLSGLAQGIVKDVGQLMGQHLELLKSEVKQELGEARDAGIGLLTGAGAGAAAGMLGSLALVHLLHEATDLPLWACYGLVGGGLGLASASLIAEGARKAANIDLIPRQTAETLREELAGARAG